MYTEGSARAINPSRIFFPLRSNVEMFQAATGYVALQERIKIASLLFDEVILEGGVYKLQMTDRGALDFRIPREGLGKGVTDQTVAETRQQFEALQQLEAPSLRVTIQPSDGSGEPRLLFDGPTTAMYFSEFQTAVSDLKGLDTPWLIWLDDDPVRFPEFSELVRQLCDDDYRASVGEVIPNRRIRDQLLKSLNHDLVLTTMVDAFISTDPIHAHLMSAKLERLGFLASTRLAIVNTYMPSVRDVPWDEINDLRSDPGMWDFRRVVGEIEGQIMELPQDATSADVRERIQSEWNKEMADAWTAVLPSFRQIAVETAESLLLDFVNIAMPFLGTGIDFARDMNNLRTSRTSWLSVFIRLTKSNPI